MSTAVSPADIISFTNLARQQQDVTPLSPHSGLTRAAEAKAADMLRSGAWSHQTAGDLPPWRFLEAAGYTYTFAGENLARNFDTPGKVIDAWLNSPSHRDNLLNPVYTDIGVAVVNGTYPNGRPVELVVEMLAAPLEGYTSVPAPTFQTTAPVEGSSPLLIPLLGLALALGAAALWLAFHLPGTKPHRRRPRLDRNLWTH